MRLASVMSSPSSLVALIRSKMYRWTPSLVHGPAHVAALVLGVGVEDVERGVSVLVRDPHPPPGHQLLVIAIPIKEKFKKSTK